MTTNHPPEGRLQALLDGEVTAPERAELEAHLGRCPDCRVQFERLGRSADQTAHALALLDDPGSLELDRVRWNVRRRRAELRGRANRRGLAAAAVVLLFASGAAAALPGSPLRSWWDARTGSEPDAELAATPEAVGGGGVFVSPSAGTVELHLEGAEPGSRITVQFTDREFAGVRAPEGSEFQSGEGWLRVRVGDGAGSLRVELPRAVPEARLVVNGTPLLQKLESELRHPRLGVLEAVDGVVVLEVPEGTEGRGEG